MKLSPDIAAGIEKMVLSMLPYESEYTPITPQAKLLDELFCNLSKDNPVFKKNWGGFEMYLEKEIDTHKKHQITVDAITYTLHESLHRNMKIVTDPEKE